MKIGQKVKWVSQSGGFATEKYGTIVAILSQGEQPVNYARDHFPHHRLLFDNNSPVQIEQIVVLVEVVINNRKPALYKPRASALKFDV